MKPFEAFILELNSAMLLLVSKNLNGLDFDFSLVFRQISVKLVKVWACNAMLLLVTKNSNGLNFDFSLVFGQISQKFATVKKRELQRELREKEGSKEM